MENVMLYPVYIHKDDGCAWGAVVPDMPGVVTAADTLDELPAMVQEAVELMYEDAPDSVPAASSLERWQHDADFQGGVWMLLDIDLSQVKVPSVRLNISLPEPLLQRIDAAAQQRRQSRSAFLAQAALHEMA